ncbi:hypothetical protein DJ93_2689 [Bacillus clarus]|uniref:Uncharacterized protein n=1 Tax=Bacillus clarus TaxID=2338372 RepID=A0A090YN68_9BACI|nr:hypothetical protein DJ93_2689 [Bacillus clarus]
MKQAEKILLQGGAVAPPYQQELLPTTRIY